MFELVQVKDDMSTLKMRMKDNRDVTIYERNLFND